MKLRQPSGSKAVIIAAMLAVAVVAGGGCQPLTPKVVIAPTTPATTISQSTCVSAGWQRPGGAAATAPEAIGDLATARVVLLGESHENAEQHRWQLHTLAALHARHPEMIIGFEMFPRQAQPVLDRWVAGQLDAQQLLSDSDWHRVWRYDPALYLPMFHFARQNRLAVVALNVSRQLIAQVGRDGWHQVPEAAREGIGQPAPATAAYRRFLEQIWRQHSHAEGAADGAAFERFVDAQLTWDRAMAEALAKTAETHPQAVVVGIIGRGHLIGGYGVAHQLRDLGLAEGAIRTALPWDLPGTCQDFSPTLADWLFGLPPFAEAATADKPRLGVRISDGESPVGAVINEVVAESVAARAGLKVGDVIQRAAGQPINDSAQLIALVARQAPGTWLPLTVTRNGQPREIIAKFPAPSR